MKKAQPTSTSKGSRLAAEAFAKIQISRMPWGQRKARLEIATTYAEICTLSTLGEIQLIVSVRDVVSHRNGISGAPFHTVCFDGRLDNGSTVRLMGTIFLGKFLGDADQCAVVRCDEAGAGEIESCFRGDNYAPFIAAIVRVSA
jgi:hypothetical protein